jgi:2-dehydro-3-deoxyphosphogluconate aldolase/(4S)-4-hydroxy-2-oxoglutarate aldolase
MIAERFAFLTAPVVPVLTVERAGDAVPLARALLAGGLPVIEVTLRTPAALDAIRAIAAEVPDVIVGAGTVTRPREATQAVAAGADFLVSPGTPADLAEALRDAGVPAMPGCATVTEAMTLAAMEFPVRVACAGSSRSRNRCRRSSSVRPAGLTATTLRPISRLPT